MAARTGALAGPGWCGCHDGPFKSGLEQAHVILRTWACVGWYTTRGRDDSSEMITEGPRPATCTGLIAHNVGK